MLTNENTQPPELIQAAVYSNKTINFKPTTNPAGDMMNLMKFGKALKETEQMKQMKPGIYSAIKQNN